MPRLKREQPSDIAVVCECVSDVNRQKEISVMCDKKAYEVVRNMRHDIITTQRQGVLNRVFFLIFQ